MASRSIVISDELHNRLAAILLREVAQVLRVEGSSLTLEAPLGELGLDSISIGELSNALNARFGLQLIPPLFFEHPTLASLGEFLLREHPEEISRALGESIPPAVSAARRPRRRAARMMAARSPAEPPPQHAAVEGADAVAIVGMSGCFPKAADPEELWRLLVEGRSGIGEVPADRWDWAQRAASLPEDPAGALRWGGFIDGIREFDAPFFEISPREAELMDPQQRLLLQHIWKALEHAGHAPASLSGTRTAVLIGLASSGYETLVSATGRPVDVFNITGVAASSGPNRVSRMLNLHGPSEPVDTACSSSLVAIHRAVRAIQSDECDAALAGGVNAILTPQGHIGLSRLGVLSADGRCKTFSSRADGYVRGEGIGVLFLKRLSAAERDGDYIHGLIRASAENHGGMASSLGAPNPKAQAELIVSAYRRARIDPRTVSYIEAHGTGTPIGDSVEINALKSAFTELCREWGGSRPRADCGIGSVKTNIGHLELAAGVAGVIKVLLQMRHRMLVPSLHSEPLNPYIELDGSGFYIARQAQPWMQRGDRADLPRRAGISSFGFGGVNAHVVVEEYLGRGAPGCASPLEQPPALVLLSARNEERLRERAAQLLQHLECNDYDAAKLWDIAYTLQVGREPMERRLGLAAESLESVRAGLRNYLAGPAKGPQDNGIYLADAPGARATRGKLETSSSVETWLREGRYGELLEGWVRGLPVDWGRLYGAKGSSLGPTRRRLPLPTYPFARYSYWPIPQVSESRELTQPAPFVRVLTDEDWYVADHVVCGQKMLSGAGCLEIARAALAASAYADASRSELVLRQITFVQPLVVSGKTAVQVRLRGDGPATAVAFEIFTCERDRDRIHAHGVASWPEPGSQPFLPTLELESLRRRCATAVDAEECYRVFGAMGVAYGPAYRSIGELRTGRDDRGEALVLARLDLPACVRDAAGRELLHPSLMDGALQASVGLLDLAGSSPPQLAVPWFLEKLVMLSPPPDRAWVLVRARAPGAGQGRIAADLDLDVCDEEGRVCVRLSGLQTRPLPAAAVPLQTSGTQEVGEPSAGAGVTALLKPVWDVLIPPTTTAWPDTAANVLLAGGTDQDRQAWAGSCGHLRTLPCEAGASIAQLSAAVGQLGRIDHVVFIAPARDPGADAEAAMLAAQETGVITLYRLIKSLISLDYAASELGITIVTRGAQSIVPDEQVDPTHASVHGLVGSLAKEYPQWRVRLVDLPREGCTSEGDPDLQDVLRLPADQQGDALAYRAGEWYRQALIECDLPPVQSESYRRAGVYVLIGGAGGLGEAFSEYLIREYEARIVWIGRRELDAAIRAKLERLGRIGQAPMYVCADARYRQALEAARARIIGELGAIHGVIHSALVLLDRSLQHMDEERFRQSLYAKVEVSVRLAQVFAQDRLDFLAFFSSMQSFSKAPGQSNYAAGCTFADAFAHRLRKHWPSPVKIMNWGYWGSVGAVASEAYRARMARLGLCSIEIGDGTVALERLLAGPADQHALMKVTQPAALERLGMPAEHFALAAAEAPAVMERLSPLIPPTPEPSAAVERCTMELDEALRDMLFAALQDLGVLTAAGSTFDEMAARLLPMYRPWLAESARLLSRHGYLEHTAGQWSVRGQRPSSLAELRSQWQLLAGRWLEAAPELAAVLRLLGASLQELPAILSGRTRATEVLFPRGSLELVQGIYRRTSLSDYFNEVLAAHVSAYLEARPRERIRLLEIGAGTGATSAAVLQRLLQHENQVEEYCYTDISRAFLLQAKEEYGERKPYVTYRALDAERPFGTQGIELGRYDIVIAANVLHATRNIRSVVRNTKAALKRNGLLLLNEITGSTLPAHLTFGLLDGWWRYEDASVRVPGSPALAPESWCRVLTLEGFTRVAFPARGAHPRGQQIVLAESDGLVRDCRPAPRTQRPQERHVPAAVAAGAALPVPASGDSHLPAERVKAIVRELIGAVLNADAGAFKDDAPLSECGVDSIVAVALIRAINARLGIALRMTAIFDHHTIALLAQHIVSEHGAGSEAGSAAQAGGSAPDARASGSRLDDIAIIGMAGRYAGAQDLREYWNNLVAGRDCISLVPPSRWDVSRHAGAVGPPATAYCKWLGALSGIEHFDSLFFNIAPAQAELMDPQQRLFLEEAYRAFEDAGYGPELLSGLQCGVYLGISGNEYESLLRERIPGCVDNGGNHSAMAAARIAYHLNLRGPALAIDTACSSSLVATHLACQALRNGEIGMALVGGVSLYLDPQTYVGMCASGMLSPSGQCRAFDNGANGFVPADGVGAVVLKRLRDARDDGDHIYGVIIGSSINQDGRTNGITAPSVASQAELIRTVGRQYHIDPQSISYVEAHGTGTKLGDPIELEALATVFKAATPRTGFCAIGSVKSNIGHASAAAGIAGLQKVALALQHRKLVPTLHFEVPNEHFDFASSPFTVNTRTRPWPRVDGRPLRAAVSSFGISGTNAHLVIEEYANIGHAGGARPARAQPVAIVLSARTPMQLRQSAERLRQHLQIEMTEDLPALAYTLQVGRAALEHRMGFVADTRTQILERLGAYLGTGAAAGIHTGEVTAASDTAAVDPAMPTQRGQREFLDALLRSWVQGARVEWTRLYPDAHPRRMSLPGYPFARERCWVGAPEGVEPEAAVTNESDPQRPPRALGPLIQRNTSSLAGQRFSSRFDGEEFFLSDHVVQGARVLPAAVYLEMARTAAEQSAREVGDSRTATIIRDVVWLRAMVVASDVEVHIGLAQQRNGEMQFEIFASDEEHEGGSARGANRKVHAQGRVALRSREGSRCAAREDLAGLRASCRRSLGGAECYELFRRWGIEYGPAHRGIVSVQAGTEAEGSGFALAQIALPECVRDTWLLYELHPSIIDCALQATVGLALLEEGSVPSSEAPAAVAMPFALDELQLFGRIPLEAWVVVRPGAEFAGTGTGCAPVDVRICDQSGQIRAQMKGLRVRVAASAPERVAASERPASPDTATARARMTARPLNTAPAVATGSRDRLLHEARTALRELIASVLKLDAKRIRNAVGLGEYGVDSLVGVQLIQRLNERFGLELPTTVIFDYPTVDKLADYLVDTHGIALESAAPRPIAMPEAAAQSMPSAAAQPQFRRVLIRGPGSAEQLEIVPATAAEPEAHQVQIAVKACSLNFSDHLCVMGLYPSMPPYPFTPGLEVSGRVLRTGAAVTDFKPGDAVIALTDEHLGGHATLATCTDTRVFRMPEGLSFEAACALPMVSITMLDAFRKADVQPDETILIQTAAGGTGLIAVQLARHHGAKIFATAGSRAKLEYLQRLGVAAGINYLECDFESEIRRLTDGRGVDVVINTLAGDAIQKGLNCLAPGGRYIEIAMTALKSARNIDLSVLSDNQSFYTVSLAHLCRRQPQRLRGYWEEMLDLVRRGVIHATVGEVFPFDRIADAYRCLAKRQNIGKVVVTVSEATGEPQAAAVPLAATPASMSAGRAVVIDDEPIAVIGMSGRFASASTLAELWAGLASGSDLTSAATRWDLAESPECAQGCRRGGFLPNIDQFDARHFHMSGVEARYTDPRQRLFLEDAWSALEDAGYAGEAIGGCSCGVYVGVAGGDYVHLFGTEGPAQSFWGNSDSVIAARIAYCLDLKGPALAVDTACSSSLVAVHLACQGLRCGDADLALAGGVSVICTPQFYVLGNRAQMLSPTGRCYAFDARADGFVPGEGVGVLVLKRLRTALSDGDHIYGVIRGSGVNQDGATSGITAPNALSQELLERHVYERFGVDPAHIQAVEAHGTGTRLGDPIEYQALTRAFRAHTDRTGFCALGSIKTNIGHAAAAAGVAGLLKMLMSLQHRQIPPSLNFANGNPHIDFDNSPFYVNTQLREWQAPQGRTRCAAVSSFGLSGTNAHVLVEEAPVRARVPVPRPGYLVVLSAHTEHQLRQHVEQLCVHCEGNPHLQCADIAFTLTVGRRHFEHRLACVVRGTSELVRALRDWLSTGAATQVRTAVCHEHTRQEDPVARAHGNECLESCEQQETGASYLPHLQTLGDLYLEGYSLPFERLYRRSNCSRIPLPSLPFQRQSYWVGELSTSTDRAVPRSRKPSDLSVARSLSALWSGTVESAAE